MDINDIALRHLAHRSRTAFEMKTYLLKKGFAESDIKDTVSMLKEHRYINDVEYVNQYLRYGFSKNKALYRIKHELREKGISEYDMEDGIYLFKDEHNVDIFDLERKNASKEAEKILKNAQNPDKKLLDKLARRLNTLGYNTGIITGILEKYR